MALSRCYSGCHGRDLSLLACFHLSGWRKGMLNPSLVVWLEASDKYCCSSRVTLSGQSWSLKGTTTAGRRASSMLLVDPPHHQEPPLPRALQGRHQGLGRQPPLVFQRRRQNK